MLAMKIADVLLLDFDKEIENTRRTLQRLPDTLDAEWTPHAKSMKVGKLAMHCATIPMFGHYILEDDGMDMANSTRPHMDLVWKGLEHALKSQEEAAGRCRASIAAASDDRLEVLWKFSFGAQVIAEAPRAAMFRMLCFDHMIHHTSQLGVYLRLLDLPGPALYGPSADEQWSPQ
jgi:uncharacterized damage-inducible protein DinB